MRRIQIAAGNDSSTAKISGQASLLNCFAEAVKNTSVPFPVAIVASPGSRKLFEVDGGYQILGMHKTATRVYFCTRFGVYQIVNETFGLLFAHAFNDAVSMADNGTDLVVIDGTTEGVAVAMITGAARTVTLPFSFRSIKFIDGYFLCARRDTGEIYASELYSTEFKSLQFATAEASPDNVQAIAVLQRQAYLLGQLSMEVWYNSAEKFPFTPNQSAFIEVGCIGRRAYVETDTAIYWVGDDLVVYRAGGYAPIRISTHGIEKLLASVDCTKAYMCEYSYNGHRHVFLQIPGLNKTMVYDELTELWHDRQYSGALHFAGHMATLNGKTYIGAEYSASIHVFEAESGHDNGVLLDREMVTPPDGQAGRVSKVELMNQFFNLPAPEKLEINMTRAEKELFNYKPIVYLSFTDDDGLTWSERDGLVMEQNTELEVSWNKCGYNLTGRRSYKFQLRSPIGFVWAGVSVG